MSEETFEVIIPAPAGRQDKKYQMQYMRGFLDDSFIAECTRPDGSLDNKTLWIKRLTATFVGLNEDDVRKMERWELQGLKLRWLEYNEVNESRFLETSSSNVKNELESLQSLQKNTTSSQVS